VFVFPWNHSPRSLWDRFHEIQEVARLDDGSPMPKAGKDGEWYGFHDFRRGFATANAGEMDLFQLQSLMQHKSLNTTRSYVNMAGQLNAVVDRLKVPDILKKPATG
jgi:integrase